MSDDWKPVIGYEGLYEVSSLGQVKSLHRGKEIVLKQKYDGAGYLCVGLSKQGKTVTKNIHRLVACAFIRLPDEKEQVNHKSLDRTNNSVENLEYVTPRENLSHRRGFLGGCVKKRDRWMAQVNIGKRNIYLGMFDSPQEAKAAHLEALAKAGINNRYDLDEVVK